MLSDPYRQPPHPLERGVDESKRSSGLQHRCIQRCEPNPSDHVAYGECPYHRGLGKSLGQVEALGATAARGAGGQGEGRPLACEWTL